MTDQTEYEFTADGVLEGFGRNGLLGLFAGTDATPEEFATYLNEVFDQDARRAIANLKDDKSVEIEHGAIRMYRPVPFEEWDARVQWRDDGE